MRNLWAKIVILAMISVFSVSCGQSSSTVLSGVNVSTTTQNNDVILSISANINLGAMSFAAITLPIINPHGQTNIGSVELVPGLGGQNMIKVNVNVSSLANVSAAQAVLPNGNAIPLIANNQTVAVNLGNGAKLYLTLSATAAAIGVAVPISAFDAIGAKLPGLNFFPVVAFNNVIATAGIFTGAQAGQNGIAFVADVSKIINLNHILSPSSSSKSLMAIQAQEVQNDVVKLDYSSHKPSAAKESALNQMLLQMNQKKMVLKSR
jgi:microcystin-dependent protein